MRILVYGYGNPGRQDDALGCECAALIQNWRVSRGLETLSTDENYQLNIEDAHKLIDYDLIIFCDASITDIEEYKMEEVVPDLTTDFSMHSVTPAFVVALGNKLFGKYPQTYQLHIKAYEFGFMNKMTPAAERNLLSAFDFLKDFIEKELAIR